MHKALCFASFYKVLFLTDFSPNFGHLLKKISIWLHWIFIAARQLSLVIVGGGYCSLPGMGFSFQWLFLLWSTGYRARGPQWSWHTGLLVPRHVGSSQTRTEPVSSALAGRFLTPGPPGKYSSPPPLFFLVMNSKFFFFGYHCINIFIVTFVMFIYL